MPENFWSRGFEVVRGFMAPADCDVLLCTIEGYCAAHDVPLVHRQVAGRSLHYRVIDGHHIAEALPQLPDVLTRVRATLEQITGRPLVPMADTIASVNVNVTPPGGEYRWHYDRNAVSALLYLNEVPGGETELYPNYRLSLPGERYGGLQQLLDRAIRLSPLLRLFGRRTVVPPQQGTLLVMRGSRTLHSVRRVEGDRDRVNIVLAYDEPGAQSSRQGLDRYLYTTSACDAGDPNYAG